jgi:hypothetical protein
VLPDGSNIPQASEFVCGSIDEAYPRRARKARERGGHALVGGTTCRQGRAANTALWPRDTRVEILLAGGLTNWVKSRLEKRTVRV